MKPKYSFLDDNETPDRSPEAEIQKFPKVTMKGSKSDRTFMKLGVRTEKGISVDPKQMRHAPLFKPSKPRMTLSGV